jgi:hypothetical protein
MPQQGLTFEQAKAAPAGAPAGASGGMSFEDARGSIGTPSQPAPPSLWSRIKDGAGDAVEGFERGVGGVVQGAIDGTVGLVARPLNKALNMTGIPQRLTGAPLSEDLGGDVRAATGLPMPRNARERVLDDVVQGGAGGIATAGAAGAAGLAMKVPGVASNFMKFLAEGPVVNTVAGATGGGATGLTREAGGGEIAQTAAGLVGNIAGGGIAHHIGAPRAPRIVAPEMVPGSLDGTVGNMAVDPAELLARHGIDPSQFTTDESIARAADRLNEAQQRVPMNGLGPDELARHTEIGQRIAAGQVDPSLMPQVPPRTMPGDVPIIAAPEGNIRGDDIGGMVGLDRKNAADAGVMGRAHAALQEDPVIGEILNSNISPQAKMATLWDRLKQQQDAPVDLSHLGPDPTLDRPAPTPWAEPTPQRARDASQPRRAPVDNGRAVVNEVYPDAVVTSNHRSADDPLSKANPNSWHTKSNAAVDVRPIKGMTFDDYVQGYKDAGYQILEAKNEVGAGRSAWATGDHWHVVLGKGDGRQVEQPMRLPPPKEDVFRGDSGFERTDAPISPTNTELAGGKVYQDRAGTFHDEPAAGRTQYEAPMGTGSSDEPFKATGSDPVGKPGHWEAEAQRLQDELQEKMRRQQEEFANSSQRTAGEPSQDAQGQYGSYAQRPAMDGESWAMTRDGHVAGADGKPVAFRNAVDAAKWAAKNKMGGDFELAVWGANSKRVVLKRKEGSTYGDRVAGDPQRAQGAGFDAATPPAGRSTDTSQRMLDGPEVGAVERPSAPDGATAPVHPEQSIGSSEAPRQDPPVAGVAQRVEPSVNRPTAVDQGGGGSSPSPGATAEPAPKAAPPKIEKPDALTLIAKAGGIADNEGHDLRGTGRLISGVISGQKRRAGGNGPILPQFAPGGGRIVTKNGMSIDRAGELLHESGYIKGERPTTAETLAYLERGNDERLHHPDDAVAVSERKAAEQDKEFQARARDQLEQAAEDHGEPLGNHEAKLAMEHMANGHTAEQALERVRSESEAERQNPGLDMFKRVGATDDALASSMRDLRGGKDLPDDLLKTLSDRGFIEKGADGHTITPEGRAFIRNSIGHGESGFVTADMLLSPFRAVGKLLFDKEFRDVDGVNLVNAVKRTAGNPKMAAEGAVDNLKRFGETVFYSTDSALRSISARMNSPTLAKLADTFHAEAGVTGKTTTRTMPEAVTRNQGRFVSKVDDALKAHVGDTKALGRIRDLLTSPNATIRATPAEHTAAAGVRDLLKQFLEYRRDAGESIGEVKDGYFPRQLRADAVFGNADKFLKGAEAAYRDIGTPNPHEAAQAYATRIMDGHLGISDAMGSSPGATSSKAREFGKAADVHLRDFYDTNPLTALHTYLTGGVKRAEEARVFGPKGREDSPVRAAWEKENGDKSQWDVMKAQIQDELRANGVRDVGVMNKIESLRTSSMGRPRMGSPKVGAAVSVVHAWNQLSTLGRATLASLPEIAMGFVRAGPRLGFTHLSGTMNEIGRRIARLPPSEASRYAEAIGAIGGENAMHILRARADDVTANAATGKILHQFYQKNGLEAWTNSGRAGAVKTAQRFMDVLAHDMASDHARTKVRAAGYLKELGISNPSEFAARIRKDIPSLEEMHGDTGHAAEYATALLRFANQVVLMPTRSVKPAWASHPLGSLVFALQSYNYAFKKNVMDRVGRETIAAVKERDPQKLAAASGLVALTGITALVQYVRHQIYGAPAGNENQTGMEYALETFDRTGLFGAASPIINAFQGLKYRRSVGQALQGSVLGRTSDGLDAIGGLALGNSSTTNAAERNAANAFYDLAIHPAEAAIGSSVLNAPLGSAMILGTGARSNKGLVPSDREAFATAVAGEKQ